MKKDTTTIKRILRQTDNTNLHGYFQNEDDFIISNGYSIIKFDMNNVDFISDIDNLNNNTNVYYNYKSFNEHITKNQDARKTHGSQTIEILVEDLKMWKKHGKKGKPFIIPTKKGFMGLNPYYLLDLASLTRQDKNNTLIKIKVIDKKAPLYIDGNGVKAILCPIVLNKTDFNKDDYLAFLNKLADCYDLEKARQEEKQAKKEQKANKAATTETANNDSVTTDNSRKRILHGFYMTFKNRDIFVATNEDMKRRYIVQAFINEMINISNHLQNITEEKRNNILNDEDVLNETKKRIAPATIEEILTRQENHIRITTNNGNTIINQSLNGFKTIMLDCYSANEGITPAQEKSFKFFSVISKINNQLTETITQDIKADLQADNRQTETTQDTTPKHTATKTATSNNKSVSLFIVKDKPQPVKLYGANIPTLERIPTYTQRIISRFKPSKSHRVYNNRVTDIKALKTDCMTFVDTVSCYNDKCAISGGMVAVNSS